MKYKDFLALLSPFRSVTDAQIVGRTAVEKSLGACLNVLPRPWSIKRWNGTTPSDEEALMIVKTTADGHHAHLSWVASATRAL